MWTVNTECISHGLTVIHTVPNTASTGGPTRAVGVFRHAYSDIEWILITTPDYFLLDMVCWQEHNQTQSTSTDIDIYWYRHRPITEKSNRKSHWLDNICQCDLLTVEEGDGSSVGSLSPTVKQHHNTVYFVILSMFSFYLWYISNKNLKNMIHIKSNLSKNYSNVL